MVTEFIFNLLENNYKIFTILDVARDIFLALIFVLSFGSLVINFFLNKKLNRVYLIELILVILFVLFFSILLKNTISSIRPISYFSFLEEQKFDSFPSQHTALAFGISFITFISNFQLAFFLLILSLWVALLSWLSLMHWPIDIIGGIIISLISTFLTSWLVQSFFRFYINKIKA
jgi:undecaprenyl-diphosphatase